MNNSPWPGFVRYFGSEISGRKLPWHYIPVWIVITTPPLYLALSVIGLASSFAGLRTRPLFPMTRERRDVLLFLTWLFVPVLVVIVLRSTLYDAWRHLFFVYPRLTLRIAVSNRAGLRTVEILRPAHRQRISVSVQKSLDDADYFISNRRGPPPSPQAEWHAIYVDGVKVLSIFSAPRK